MVTKEIADSIWGYDPDTGYFFWRISPKIGVLVGSRAGYFDGKYWKLRYKKANYKASRVAWLITTGSWPKNQIDHINGVRGDDRFVNLREATNAQNCRNRSLRKDNKTKMKGVYPARHGYASSIMVDGARIHLGSFKSADEAKSAYDFAAKKYHMEFARTQ